MAQHLPYSPKKILNIHKHADGWFWLKYTCDPYIGCEHGCEYCYSREGKYCPYDSPDMFSKLIKIKENAPELLRKELKKRPKDLIDPGFYQPADKKYRMMRKMLEVCLELEFPVLIIERSPLILQDIDLLKKINQRTWAGVLWSFSDYKSGKATKVFEPTTPTPEVSFSAMRKLADAGIFQGAAFMPVLPLITDTDETFEGIIKETQKNGGQCILFGGLTLSDEQKDRYLQIIKKNYPNLYDKYTKLYKGSYGGSQQHYLETAKRFFELCNKAGMKYRMPRPIKFFPKHQHLNKMIAEHLQNMAYECQHSNEPKYKFWAYLKAAWTIDELKHDIQQIENFADLPNIGQKMADKISDIIKSVL